MSSLSTLQWATYSSAIFGLIAILIAIRQTAVARRIKRIHKSQCSTRCIDLLSLVEALATEAQLACTAANSERLDKAIAATPEVFTEVKTLTATAEATMNLTQQLSRFCERLNEEFEEEFGHPVRDNLTKILASLPCVRYFRKARISETEVHEEPRTNSAGRPGTLST